MPTSSETAELPTTKPTCHQLACLLAMPPVRRAVCWPCQPVINWPACWPCHMSTMLPARSQASTLPTSGTEETYQSNCQLAATSGTH